MHSPSLDEHTNQGHKTAQWQVALKQAVRSVPHLLEKLALQASDLSELPALDTAFPLCVTQSFIERMEKGNPHDPLLRQVLPLAQEHQITPGYTKNPVGDIQANAAPGLLHKYHGRVLLTLTSGCAIHCRYCFRQHFPYAKHGVHSEGWAPALDYIRKNTHISEVILSGGDPLLVNDTHLMTLGEQLTDIPHVKCLRIHTRLPIVLPERITDTLCQWLHALPLNTVVVIHSNHPQEINTTVGQGLQKLHQTGTCLLNQSVLLKGVNDNANTLIALSQTLFDHHVLPYYLHQLDKTQGTAHFAVDLTTATQVVENMRIHLPGYLVPKWVEEISGSAYKEPMLHTKP